MMMFSRLFSLIILGSLPLSAAEQGGRGELEILKAARMQDAPQPFSQRELGFETPRISAMRVIRYTLRLNPQVELQEAAVTEQSGRVQSEKGPFDTHVTGRLAPHTQLNQRNIRYREPNPPPPATPPMPYPNPLRNRSGVGEYELGIRRMLTNGVVINPTVGFTQNNQSDFGGTFENDVRGVVGFNVVIPLGKGAGQQSNLAPLIAARFDLLASTLQLRHITSESVAAALQAYWASKAAEEMYRLRVESEAIASRLLQSTTALAEADEIAPAELAQIIADTRNATALRIRSETELIAARQSLATAVGLPASSLLMSPLGKDPFPEPPDMAVLPLASDLISIALRLRDDLRAAEQTAASRKVMMDASYLNLRPLVNLRLGGSYSPFETRNQVTTSQGHLWQAGAELTVDWPIENNEAKGEVIQHEARYRSSRISIDDAQRVITSQVITSLAGLEGAALNVRLFRDATEWYTKALASQEELFALGQGSLSDTITARQRLVDAQVNYVVARQNYATALVQLRFACGLLIFSDEAGSWVHPGSWMQIPMVKK